MKKKPFPLAVMSAAAAAVLAGNLMHVRLSSIVLILAAAAAGLAFSAWSEWRKKEGGIRR